jgi:hypothetical protein
MKYLPAIVFGVMLFFLVFYIFEVLIPVYSPLLGYLASLPNLNVNSIEYLWLLASDSLVFLLAAALVVSCNRKFFKKYPFNWVTVGLLQLPLSVFIVAAPKGLPSKFSNMYEIATNIPTIVGFLSVVIVGFGVFAYNTELKGTNT